MVEKLQKVLADFKQIYPKLQLFALIKMDELVDRWSLIISIPKIDEATQEEAFKTAISLLKKYFSEEELFSIARVGLLGEENHLVQGLLLKRSGARISSEEKINGNRVHEGFVLEANPVVG